MSFNTFGHSFRVTTFGESHGAAIGCVVDGCPPRIALREDDIQPYLDRRRPGQSRFTTQRQEPDSVKILSGVFRDETTGVQMTTGTPIALLIDINGLPAQSMQFLFEMLRFPPDESAKLNAELMTGNVFRKT